MNQSRCADLDSVSFPSHGSSAGSQDLRLTILEALGFMLLRPGWAGPLSL